MIVGSQPMPRSFRHLHELDRDAAVGVATESWDPGSRPRLAVHAIRDRSGDEAARPGSSIPSIRSRPPRAVRPDDADQDRIGSGTLAFR